MLAAAGTLLAGFFQDAPRAFAVRTGLRDAENAARGEDLAATAAGAALAHFGAGFRAGAVAAIAFVGLGDGNFLLGAVGRLFQRELQVVAQIIAALRAAGILAAAEKILKDAATAAAAENFAKDIERIMKTAATTACPGARIKGGVAVLVVGGAFLRVAQDFVGMAEFLEIFLGNLVARVFVRVKFHGLLAVGFFDFVVARVLIDAENFVIVAFSHGRTLNCDG